MLRSWKFLVRLLKDRPHTAGAEIGTCEGRCALGLLTGLPNLEELICVDLWEHNDDFHRLMLNKDGRILNADWGMVLDKFIENVIEPYRDRVVALRMSSVGAAHMIVDKSLDFVFINANHAYDFINADIIAWTPKVKRGGIIAGHDYVNKPNYGVIQAVKERFTEFEVHKRSKVWYTMKGK